MRALGFCDPPGCISTWKSYCFFFFSFHLFSPNTILIHPTSFLRFNTFRISSWVFIQFLFFFLFFFAGVSQHKRSCRAVFALQTSPDYVLVFFPVQRYSMRHPIIACDSIATAHRSQPKKTKKKKESQRAKQITVWFHWSLSLVACWYRKL